MVLTVWPGKTLPSRFIPPQGPESYRISREGAARLVIVGSDATGAMYGALDVAEELRWLPPGRGLANIEPRRRSPYLEIRGVNQFLHQQALDDPSSWFYSDDFWRGYLDALARSRHNFLDLHAVYDLSSTGFPNVFPYLIHLDEYPEADVGAEQTRRNLAVFNKVISLAADRGIKVGLMNYSASARVPSGKLADYTSRCVEALLRDCPGLWAFGFRVGESGQPEDFFKLSYLDGIRRAGKPIALYSRSWIASRAKMEEIAAAHPGRFLVEIKYNGEHLGLPYQVQGERMSTWGSYSYQTYTNKPRNFDLLWQVRAGGTHSIFQWGDPEFARRVARTCRLGDGAGFSIEPLTAYCPIGEYYLNPKAFPHPFFRWEFQRDWLWYEVWGRAGYDPTVSDATFEHLFRERYGDRSGPVLFRSMLAASKIVPLIYSYHCLGPDSRNMAPEFETGDGFSGDRRADGSGVRNHYGLRSFLSVEPLDDSVMDSPNRYADHLVKGEAPLPFGPNEAAEALERYAAEALTAERAVALVPPAQADACRDQVMDAEALAALARYYAAKIRAVTEVALYQRTGDLAQLERARVLLREAIAHWGELSDVTGRHFTPINERLRMLTASFTWAEEGKDLPEQLDELEALRHQPPKTPARAVQPAPMPGPSAVASCVAVASADRRTAAVTARVSDAPPGGSVTLFYRPMPSFHSWLSMPMVRSAPGVFTATVPLTPEGLLYRVAVADAKAHLWQWPFFLQATPYLALAPWPPSWVRHGSVALPEGAPVYHPAVGEAVFSDVPYRILVLPPELSGLTGLRYPRALLARAEDQSFGGYPIPFRVLRKTRLFLAISGSMPSGFGRYAAKALTVGADTLNIYARDYDPGDHTLVFDRGPIGILLGFKELTAADPPLKEPSIRLGGQIVWDVVQRGFVTTSSDLEPYDARLGATVYLDRAYAIRRLPKELEGCLGLRFSNDAGKLGGLALPFRLDRPATLYVVFGNPEDGPWEKPPSGWRLYARNAFQMGPGDDVLRSIYSRDYPAGDGALVLQRGTAVVLGFR